jgi:hypothetical protein
MRLLRTVVASACILGMAGGAAVLAHAQPWYPDHPYYHHHHDWRARQAWRWRHEHAYVAPVPYAYYAPPPVYYSQPGVSFGVTIP